MDLSFATMTDTEPLTPAQQKAMNNIMTQYMDKIESGLTGPRKNWTEKQKMD